MITYQIESELDPAEFRDLLIKSTMGERRPVDDSDRIRKMVSNSNLLITARSNGVLIGVARSVTDFVYCTYLSDLAVAAEEQGKGIGTELIKQTKKASPGATLILLSAPSAIGYYLKIGMEKHEACFILKDLNNLT